MSEYNPLAVVGWLGVSGHGHPIINDKARRKAKEEEMNNYPRVVFEWVCKNRVAGGSRQYRLIQRAEDDVALIGEVSYRTDALGIPVWEPIEDRHAPNVDAFVQGMAILLGLQGAQRAEAVNG